MNTLRRLSHWPLVALFSAPLLPLILNTGTKAQPTRRGMVSVESDELLALAFSPDGTLLAGGGKDKTVRVWELRKNRMRVLGISAQLVRSVSFSPDGRTLAAAGDDGVVYLWDVGSGKLNDTLRGPEGEVTCVTYSRDGKWLASGGNLFLDPVNHKWRREVKLWDAKTRELKWSLFKEPGHVSQVAFSPDGMTLAAVLNPSHNDKTFCGVKLWDVKARKEKRSLVQEPGYLGSVTFSPDGKLLAAGGGFAVPAGKGTKPIGQVKVWELASGKLIRTITGPDGYFRPLAFSPDSHELVTGGSGPDKEYQAGNVRGSRVVSETKLWKLSSSELLWTVEGYYRVYAVAMSPDGATVASCDNESLKLIDAKKGTVRQVLRKVTQNFRSP